MVISIHTKLHISRVCLISLIGQDITMSQGYPYILGYTGEEKELFTFIRVDIVKAYKFPHCDVSQKLL